ncbi:MAG: three-Cys-motif partner protein TcmP, partial [Planctomycetes bacterium]|nr:three-Cys-motif partner protein TcmP [Planctomycetota bacterium]
FPLNFPLMPSNKDSTHRFGGPWTEIKLDVLRRYLAAYTTALKKQRFRLLYIDAFAGSGDYLPADSGTAKSGSARIALETEGFSRYCFIEKNQGRFRQLELVRGEHPDEQVELFLGDANQVLPRLLTELDAGNWRGILFLDPYGMSFQWSTLQAIAATELLDLWYLFPIMGVYRQAAISWTQVDEYKAAALDSCLGTPDWRTEFYRQSQQLNLFGDPPGKERFANVDAIEQFVHDRLKQVFPAVSNPLRLPRTGATYYSLFFAVSNQSPKAQGLALKIAGDILGKA